MNPFGDISDPAILRAMVQDGVTCQECHGARYVGGPVGFDCPTCNGTGHTPLSNPDLDALAACWCEGKELAGIYNGHWRELERDEYGTHVAVDDLPAYTTSPDAAMRLAVKYQVGLDVQGYTHIAAFVLETDINVKYDEDTVHSRCRAWTEAALIAALTERMRNEP